MFANDELEGYRRKSIREFIWSYLVNHERCLQTFRRRLSIFRALFWTLKMEAEDSKLYIHRYKNQKSHKEHIYIESSVVPGYYTKHLAGTSSFMPHKETNTILRLGQHSSWLRQNISYSWPLYNISYPDHKARIYTTFVHYFVIKQYTLPWLYPFSSTRVKCPPPVLWTVRLGSLSLLRGEFLLR
jgi:hypothetical protein